VTDGERAVWAAVYAAHVHTPRLPGWEQPTPERIERYAALKALMAVEQLRRYAEHGKPDNAHDVDAHAMAREVLR
jgi:hypothetical protein